MPGRGEHPRASHAELPNVLPHLFSLQIIADKTLFSPSIFPVHNHTHSLHFSPPPNTPLHPLTPLLPPLSATHRLTHIIIILQEKQAPPACRRPLGRLLSRLYRA
eukprot:763776-Hanusia_phi.AAC.6